MGDSEVIESEREEARKRFVVEARQSMKEYRETGLHLTLEESAAWVETWGTENEVGPPECHT